MFRRLLFFSIAVFASVGAMHAQAVPAALVPGSVEAGGFYSLGRPDYVDPSKNFFGLGAVADVNFPTRLGLIGAEGEFRFMKSNGNGVGERNLEIGPRYIYQLGRWEPYAKLLAELGSITAPSGTGSFSNSYGALAFGGGVDYRFRRHITIRIGDFEYQRWNFHVPAVDGNPCVSPIPCRGTLTPFYFSTGVKYRFF